MKSRVKSSLRELNETWRKLTQSPKSQARLRVDAKLAIEKLIRGAPLLKKGGMLLCRGEYIRARDTLIEACAVLPPGADRDRARSYLEHCKRRAAGILDLRHMNLGLIVSGNEVTSSSGIDSALKEAASKRPVGRAHKGMSVSKAVYQLFDEKGIDGTTFAEAEAVAKSVKPDTKFNESHFGYYKSQYKKLQKNPVSKGDSRAEFNKKVQRHIKAREEKRRAKQRRNRGSYL